MAFVVGGVKRTFSELGDVLFTAIAGKRARVSTNEAVPPLLPEKPSEEVPSSHGPGVRSILSF